jgi:hypothetical protein
MATRPARRKSPPYPFLLEALAPLDPEVKPMFSGFAVYHGNRLLCMLRESLKQPKDNGLWLVFSETANPADPAHRRDFPSLRKIALLGGAIAHWLLIPADSPAFETEALHACDLILRHDPRLGRIPESRKSESRKSKPRKQSPKQTH